MTTRGSAGHVLPLVPFADAVVRAGHQVLVAGQLQNEANVVGAGLPFAPLGDPPAERWRPLMERFAKLGVEHANDAMVGEFFAGIDTSAMLPALESVVEDFAPDVILRESFEYASTLVGEARGIPVARVGLGLASLEESTIRLAAKNLEPLRATLGLPPDPNGDRMRDTLYLTMVPEPLEDAPTEAPVRRFAPLPAAPQAAASVWEAGDAPLVYVTFGSVTAGEHLPYYPSLYRQALAALAPLDARILLTIGAARDVAELGPLPPNARVERWVPHDAIAPHADVVVGHGGYGTTLGTLRHATPLVVLPLFSLDQWANAAAVERVGAGLALDSELQTRSVLALPAPETMGELAGAVEAVLEGHAYRAGAQRLADAMRALPSVDEAVEDLAEAAGLAAPSRARR